MRTNTPATLYNACKIDGKTVYQRTVLAAVYWEDNKQAVIRKTGAAGADSATVYIPFSVDAGGRRHKKPKAYAVDPCGAFTIAPKDYLVKGVCRYEYGPDAPISQLTQNYDDVLTITGVDTKDMGSPAMRHWEVSGK